MKFKHFLSLKNFLFIRTTFKKNFYNEEISINFIDFKLLTDVLDNCCEKLTIQIPLEEIKEDTILNLETILKNNPGKTSLKFTIWDENEKIEVNLPSRNIKITISNALLTILQKQQINYKLN